MREKEEEEPGDCGSGVVSAAEKRPPGFPVLTFSQRVILLKNRKK
jgi:hypothetical protein